MSRALGKSQTDLSVLFVHMPMADPVLPNLGMEILAQRLREDGVRCDVLYGTLNLPPAVSPEVMHGLVGHCIFTPLYFNLDVDLFVNEVVECLMAASPQASAVHLSAEIHTAIASAEICIERCLAAIPFGEYHVVAFSIIFDTQKVPSATLSARLKAYQPSIKVLFGGTGCDGDMAVALLERFPEVDAVVRGDADCTITKICKSLVDGCTGSGQHPDGYFGRDLVPPRVEAGVVKNLENRPMPDYASFVAQRKISAYASLKLTILFEGSRGCWWGEKHHCLFCGIRTIQEGYRQRSAASVFREIQQLHGLWRPDLIYATDAILSREHAFELLADVAKLQEKGTDDIQLFFEIKSNVGRKEVALFAAAGVVAVQPGIESFSSSILKRIKKGTTSIRQVETLKWLSAYGIDTIYGLIAGTPGESIEDINEQITLIQNIHHLQPPSGLNPLGLHRFSPYFESPEEYGLKNIRPFEMQRIAYRASDNVLRRLCYELNYDSNEFSNEELRHAHEALKSAVHQWQSAYREGNRLVFTQDSGEIIVIRCIGDKVISRPLNDLEGRIYRSVQSAASLRTVVCAVQCEAKAAEGVLRSLESDRLVIFLDNKWLALALPATVNVFEDAGLDCDANTAGIVPVDSLIN